MSREELIKKFVSAEFNRFLEYYKNAVDINVKESSSRDRYDRDKGSRSERGDRYERRDRSDRGDRGERGR